MNVKCENKGTSFHTGNQIIILKLEKLDLGDVIDLEFYAQPVLDR